MFMSLLSLDAVRYYGFGPILDCAISSDIFKSCWQNEVPRIESDLDAMVIYEDKFHSFDRTE